MSKWTEIHSTHIDETKQVICIDAWQMDDDAEEGKVIAEIRLCNLEVTYLDADAKTDGYAQEAIKNAIMQQKIQKHMTELEQEICNYEKDRECLMDYDTEISVCARTQNRLKEILETKIIERYKGE